MRSITKTSKHLTYQERRLLSEAIKYKDRSIYTLAAELGRSPRTLYKELERAEVSPPKITKRGKKRLYDDERAQSRYEREWKTCHTRPRIPHLHLRSVIETLLKKEYTPKQIAGRLQYLEDNNQVISHETIYQWIYHERKDLAQYLPLKRKKRRSRVPKEGTTYQIPDRVGLTTRNTVEHMDEFGHWEADLVGASSCATILTIIEKKTRYTIYHLIPDKKAHTMKYGILFSLCKLPLSCIKSITYDNGSENVLHAEINERLECNSYFCEPYRGWEKGQVEFSIRLLRRYFPKKTNFNIVEDEQCSFVQDKLNNRPRECLNFRTPKECFLDFVNITP